MRQSLRMNDLTDDEVLAEMFGDIAFNALSAIGDKRDLRFDFFQQFVALARRFRDQGRDESGNNIN